MNGRLWRAVLAELGQTRGIVDAIDRRMEKVEVILMVREPTSAVAADAYDGLRKQVVTAATDRWAHLAQLAQLAAALDYGAGNAELRTMADGWIAQASLERVADTAHPNAAQLFQLIEDLGGALEVVEPAYCDRVTGRIVQQGRARRRAPRRPGFDPGYEQRADGRAPTATAPDGADR